MNTLFALAKASNTLAKFTQAPKFAPPNNCNKTRLSAQTAVVWAGKEALVIFLLRDDGYMLRVNKLFRKICLALAANVFLSLVKVSCYSFAAFSGVAAVTVLSSGGGDVRKGRRKLEKRVGKRMKAQ